MRSTRQSECRSVSSSLSRSRTIPSWDRPRVAQRKKGDNATAAATADGATGIGEEVASEDKKKTEVTQIHVTAFREQCEQVCQQDIDCRVVMLVAEGSDVDIRATVTKTRWYQNLTEAATVMGFYDVKCEVV